MGVPVRPICRHGIRSHLFVIGSFVTLAGCSNKAGGGGMAFGDAGPDAATASAVIGMRSITCHQAPADVDMPMDLSKAIIEALIPDASPTGYRVLNGAGAADGTFVVPDVPDGITYMLRIQTRTADRYYVTDQHFIKARSERIGRCVPTPATTSMSTPVTFTLRNMTPFSVEAGSSDRLEIDSFALNYRIAVPPTAVTGSTPVTISVDWTDTLLMAPLVDAAAGDDLYVLHLRSDTVEDAVTQRPRTVTHVIDWADLTGTTLHSGIEASIAGTFQHATSNRTVSFSNDRALFDAGFDASSAVSGMRVQILANPLAYSFDGSEGDAAATLAGFDLTDTPRSISLVQTVTDYMYADPFPASWKRSIAIEYNREKSVETPMDGASLQLTSGHFQLLAYADAGTLESRPIFAAPDFTVAGENFSSGGKIEPNGESPVVIEWSSVSTAALYSLEIFPLYPSGAPRGVLVLGFETSGTSLRIPAGLFADGAFYQMALGVTQSETSYTTGDILPYGVPLRGVGATSGRFRFITTCGDGIIQSGEDCDTGGETATCNIDCTKPSCGDGLRNATAGEDCDGGVARLLGGTCSSRCKLL